MDWQAARQQTEGCGRPDAALSRSRGAYLARWGTNRPKLAFVPRLEHNPVLACFTRLAVYDVLSKGPRNDAQMVAMARPADGREPNRQSSDHLA